MRVRAVRNRFGFKSGLRCVLVLGSLLFSTAAFAEAQVYFLRGWFGVFSTGMDAMVEQLRSKGIKAEAIGHLAWRGIVDKIAAERAAGNRGPVILAGHSQGANNVIEMARELEKKKVPVDLLITLAPYLQDPVPTNVVRALNYYQAGGWGAPLSGDKGFRGKISNIDMQGDLISTHVNIDKNDRVQSDIVREVTALSRRPATAAAPAR
jgi:hypothetical protein